MKGVKAATVQGFGFAVGGAAAVALLILLTGMTPGQITAWLAARLASSSSGGGNAAGGSLTLQSTTHQPASGGGGACWAQGG